MKRDFIVTKNKDIRKIRKNVKKLQDEGRFEHTLGVEYTAAILASLYDVDVSSARLAGILHDCAKCMSDKKRLEICKKKNLDVTAVEQRNPFLLHAKVGAYLAEYQYGIKDSDILNSIKYHTTGRANMSKLEKIIFIADYIEPGRNKIQNLNEIRKIAYRDLDQALLVILQNIVEYLKKCGGEVDPMTEQTLNYYKNLQ